MKITFHSVALLAPIIFLIGCGVKEAPLDANGKTPQQVMMDTYVLILEENYAEAQKNTPRTVHEATLQGGIVGRLL